jgi:hypothetical protein
MVSLKVKSLDFFVFKDAGRFDFMVKSLDAAGDGPLMGRGGKGAKMGRKGTSETNVATGLYWGHRDNEKLESKKIELGLD